MSSQTITILAPPAAPVSTPVVYWSADRFTRPKPMAAIVLKDSRDYQGEAALAEITLAVFGLDGTIRIETAMYGPQEAGHWSLPGNNTPLFKRPSY